MYTKERFPPSRGVSQGEIECILSKFNSCSPGEAGKNISPQDVIRRNGLGLVLEKFNKQS